MARLIVLHAHGDAETAQGLCSDLPEFRAVAIAATNTSEPVKLGAGVVLCLVWSRTVAAEGAVKVFSAVAELNRYSTIVLRLDETPLPGALKALRAPEIDGFLSSQELSHHFRDFGEQAKARVEREDSARRPEVWARREVAGRRDVDAGRARRETFSGGFTRGFASSVAVIGLGGSLALGVSDQLRQEGFFVLDANASTHAVESNGAGLASVIDPDSIYQPFASSVDGVGSFEQLDADADMLRATAERERQVIAARLAEVAANLDASRKLTEQRIELLERAGDSVITPQQFARASAPAASTRVETVRSAALELTQVVSVAFEEDEALDLVQVAEFEAPAGDLHEAAMRILAKETLASAGDDGGVEHI